MNKKAEIKEVFDSGIIMSIKAAERLNAVMEAEGKKGFGLRKAQYLKQIYMSFCIF